MSEEGVGKGSQDGDALLAEGADVAAEGAEAVDGGGRAEAAGDLLFELHHAGVALGLVVVEGDAQVGHEGEGLVAVGGEAEILRIACALAEQGTREFYGWRMGQYLEDEGQRETGFGSLYRTLNRLQDSGYLESEWVPPEKDGSPPRRLYQIPAEGSRAYATARRTPVSGKLIPRFVI